MRIPIPFLLLAAPFIVSAIHLPTDSIVDRQAQNFRALSVDYSDTASFAVDESRLPTHHQKKHSRDHKLAPEDQEIGIWQVYKHKKFPKYSIRTKSSDKLCDPSVKQIVGYLDVDETKHFFFWFFESRSSPSTDPLVLWLNGGPGCSSLTGLLMELGPCRVNKDGKGTTVNRDSWNNNANLIFLDQPVNAGFSYTEGEPVSSSDAAAQDVYAFLQLFLDKYKQYAKLDFHVTGESYAGHYIPAIAQVISEQNGSLDPDNTELIPINLKSLAIGNGLTDPLHQYASYPEFACNNSYGPILDQKTCADMRSKVGTCQNLLNACYKYQSKFTCVPSAIYCNNALIGPVQKTGINVYDIRTQCEPGNQLCYPIARDIEAWANTEEVQAILGVDRQFQSCNMDVNLKFLMAGDWSKPYVNALPPLLEQGVHILIYAGDADYICNWMGNKAWTLNLEWYGQEEFQSAKDVPIKSSVTGKPLGEYREHKNFAFLRVFGAGHMVPYDQPEHSLEFITKWINKSRKN